MHSHLFFQYCQKLVIVSADKKSVLLAKRTGEADYDGTFSFVGGKVETSDETLIDGMRREKNEEIGEEAKLKVLAQESYNVLFRKKDGSSMIIPHIAAVFESGKIRLSDEYSSNKWVALDELEGFEPKIESIPEIVKWAADKLATIQSEQLVEI